MAACGLEWLPETRWQFSRDSVHTGAALSGSVCISSAYFAVVREKRTPVRCLLEYRYVATPRKGVGTDRWRLFLHSARR